MNNKGIELTFPFNIFLLFCSVFKQITSPSIQPLKLEMWMYYHILIQKLNTSYMLHTKDTIKTKPTQQKQSLLRIHGLQATYHP